MKLLRILIALSLGVPVLAPALAYGATINITGPQTLTVGKTYTATVSVTPGPGEKIYTAKVAIAFPAEVSPQSFSFGSTWMPLSQPGYDSLSASSIVKTAGYPGGLASGALFGTISFTAKSAGSGAIAVTAASQLFDGSNQNALSNRGTLSYTAANPVTTTPSEDLPKVTIPKSTSPAIPGTTRAPATNATRAAHAVQAPPVADTVAVATTTADMTEPDQAPIETTKTTMQAAATAATQTGSMLGLLFGGFLLAVLSFTAGFFYGKRGS